MAEMSTEIVRPPVSLDRRLFSRVRDPRLRYVGGVGVLAALYYGSARIGYELEFAGPVAAIVWLPAGVGISFLYLGGLRFWPGVLAGDLLANQYSAIPLASAMGQTCGNVLEVVVATLLMRRLVREGSPLDSVPGIWAMFTAIAVGTAVSATIGPLSLLPSSALQHDELASVARTWWLGDFAGALVVVPLALAWWRPFSRRLERPHVVEAAALFATTGVLTLLVLQNEEPHGYLMFPALIWAAIRFRQRGATLAIAVIVGLTVWDTTHHTGPFVYESVTRSVLNAQLFIAVTALSTLCLAAVVSERQRLAEGLAASRVRLVEATDAERRRLEHDLHDGAQQRLFSLAFRLRDATRSLERAAPGETERLLREAEGDLNAAIEELRDLAHGIHPSTLTVFGLAKAIQDIALRSPVDVEVTEMPIDRFDPTAEATAYYVIAEAVTNAQRHAHAESIRVRIAQNGKSLLIEVADDGAGGADEHGGSGLQGLRDRVEAIGGSFQVVSTRGSGTRITAVIPVNDR